MLETYVPVLKSLFLCCLARSDGSKRLNAVCAVNHGNIQVIAH